MWPLHRFKGMLPLLAVTICANATTLNPVAWVASVVPQQVTPGGTLVLQLRAVIEPGYHLYSMTTPSGGPIRTRFRVNVPTGITASAVRQPKPDTDWDSTLDVKVETFSGTTVFLVPLLVARSLPEGNYEVEVVAKYQACSKDLCLAPVDRRVVATVAVRRATGQVSARPNTGALAGLYQ